MRTLSNIPPEVMARILSHLTPKETAKVLKTFKNNSPISKSLQRGKSFKNDMNTIAATVNGNYTRQKIIDLIENDMTKMKSGDVQIYYFKYKNKPKSHVNYDISLDEHKGKIYTLYDRLFVPRDVFYKFYGFVSGERLAVTKFKVERTVRDFKYTVYTGKSERSGRVIDTRMFSGLLLG